MINFIEGTLLISNVLLIFFSIVYGFLIISRKKTEESTSWIYFLIASALFFISELFGVADDLLGLGNIGILKAVLRISFGIIVLFAFLSKYSEMDMPKKKKS